MTRECRIRCGPEQSVSDLDITVTAMPYESAGRTYTLLTILDASSEKRRRALERLFFHDIANIAGGLAGIANALRSATNGDEREEMLGAMEYSARALLDEIEAQRQLASAEAGDLPVAPENITSSEILAGVVDALRYHPVSRDRRIVIDGETPRFACVTDPVLLRRVLVNLAKNALEATPPGGTVTLASARTNDEVSFTIHNAGLIPEDVQHQLFHRSFSTKGDGRGLGAYSVRLLTEQYLGGRVSFTSTNASGTQFTVAVPVS